MNKVILFFVLTILIIVTGCSSDNDALVENLSFTNDKLTATSKGGTFDLEVISNCKWQYPLLQIGYQQSQMHLKSKSQ